jgi:hypothetical protein
VLDSDKSAGYVRFNEQIGDVVGQVTVNEQGYHVACA